MKIYKDTDIDAAALAGARIAIIGYGSQGRAHALNLKDSGHDVVVGVRRDGAGWKQAQQDGLEVAEPPAAVAGAKLVAILIPDTAQPDLYATIAPELAAGTTLLFAHGFNIHFGEIVPDASLDVVMIAPKGPGGLVRRQYEQGRGVPCLVAVHQDATGEGKARALAYAQGLGGGRGGVLETTFKEETETDLFGEQAVLCGGATELIVKGFEVLTEAGYQPEVAYFEVMHELKLIVDLLHEGGLAKMHKYISETAAWGDMTSGPRVVNEDSVAAMRAVLQDIQDGTFARRWIDENKAGQPEYKKLMQQDTSHPIEQVGTKLRAQMPWLESD
ncbi:MAG: ketol-acid reductoisomerase [Gammaproteobacteria bacterium]|nr:ketol-acid reductoisomerase [Gammaproteobacteria bacterium]